jgi:mono/diheme cytochrome c family protein
MTPFSREPTLSKQTAGGCDMFRGVFFTGAALVLGTSLASAQDAAIGSDIYQERCAVCHGDTGAGDGLVSELFDKKPRNLRMLAKDNGGVYPFDQVYKAIDGRREIRGHGYSKMPIWGEFFMSQSMESAGVLDPAHGAELAQGRILAIVYYLQTLQDP